MTIQKVAINNNALPLKAAVVLLVFRLHINLLLLLFLPGYVCPLFKTYFEQNFKNMLSRS